MVLLLLSWWKWSNLYLCKSSVNVSASKSMRQSHRQQMPPKQHRWWSQPRTQLPNLTNRQRLIVFVRRPLKMVLKMPTYCNLVHEPIFRSKNEKSRNQEKDLKEESWAHRSMDVDCCNGLLGVQIATRKAGASAGRDHWIVTVHYLHTQGNREGWNEKKRRQNFSSSLEKYLLVNIVCIIIIHGWTLWNRYRNWRSGKNNRRGIYSHNKNRRGHDRNTTISMRPGKSCGDYGSSVVNVSLKHAHISQEWERYHKTPRKPN